MPAVRCRPSSTGRPRLQALPDDCIEVIISQCQSWSRRRSGATRHAACGSDGNSLYESSRGRLCSRPLSHHRTCFIASGGSPKNRQTSRVTASCPGHFLARRRGRLGPLAESRQLHCLRPASSTSIRSILPSSPVPQAAQVPALLDVRPFPMPSHRYYDLC